jgi:hypothetical protein
MVVIAVLLGQGGERELLLLDQAVSAQRLTPDEASEAGLCLGVIRRHLASKRFSGLSEDQVQAQVDRHVRACAAEARTARRAAGEGRPRPPARAPAAVEGLLAAAERGLQQLDEAIAAQHLTGEEVEDARPCLTAMRPQLAAGLFVDATPEESRVQVEGFVEPCAAETRSRLAARRAMREELAAKEARDRAAQQAEEAVKDYARTHPELVADYQSWVRCTALQDLETAKASWRREQRKGRRVADQGVLDGLTAAASVAKGKEAAAEAALRGLQVSPRACTSRAVKRLEACLLQDPPSEPCAAAQWLYRQP